MGTYNEIFCNKTKSMVMVRWEQTRVKTVINGEIIKQVSTFKYLGSRKSIIQTNTDLEENIGNYKKLNGCINKHFGKSMRRVIKQTMQQCQNYLWNMHVKPGS
jgi:hypothetical protein